MRTILRVCSLIVILLALSFTPALAAESKAVQTMATILEKLNHFPSDSEKATLKGIVDDKNATAHERTIAQAMINLQHAVSPDDKPKLNAVVKDEKAPASVKTLANVILNLNHKPTDADKEKLKKLTS
jgi:hypothetical protein